MLERLRRGPKTVVGFRNHQWNGLTTLAAAQALATLLETGAPAGLIHIHSDDVTKADLVQRLSDSFGLGLTVTVRDAPTAVDRRLRTAQPDRLALLEIPSLDRQLRDLVALHQSDEGRRLYGEPDAGQSA